METIDQERCTNLPPLPRCRRRRGRRVLTYDRYRILRHYVLDPERIWLINCMSGSPWADVLGSPDAALHPAPSCTRRGF